MKFRSMLFMPALRIDRLDSALGTMSDWIVLDLEDGVSTDQKPEARRNLRELAEAGYRNVRHRIAVRINPLNAPEGSNDIRELLTWPQLPPLLIISKVESTEILGELLKALPVQASTTNLLVMIESPAGVERAFEILSLSTRIAAVGFGSLDYAAVTGCGIDFGSQLFARSRIVNAAAACEIPAIDGVYLNLRDTNGLEEEARSARCLGFDGKFAVHPNQVDAINNAFTYGSEEVAQAKALLDAASRSRVGAFEFEGKMVDAPVIRRAKTIVANSLED